MKYLALVAFFTLWLPNGSLLEDREFVKKRRWKNRMKNPTESSHGKQACGC